MVAFNEVHNAHLNSSIGVVSVKTENKKWIVDYLYGKKKWIVDYLYGVFCMSKLKRKNKKIQKSKILNFNFKNLGNDITQYPFVEIKWLDIEGDSGWQDTKTLKNSKLPTCVSKGYLLSQAKGITRIFTDYIETKEKPTFDNIGNTTIIPTSVIVSIKKINL